MALINQQMTAMFKGVSRQSQDLREPEQCEEQINFDCDVINGLYRRNGVKIIPIPTSGFVVDPITATSTKAMGIVTWRGETSVVYAVGTVLIIYRISDGFMERIPLSASLPAIKQIFNVGENIFVTFFQRNPYRFIITLDDQRISGSVSSVTDLSTLSPLPTDGSVWAVLGESGTERTTVYFKYHVAVGTSKAYWEETFGKERLTYLADTAMTGCYPWILTPLGTGYSARQMEYLSQRVGNRTNRPWPSWATTTDSGTLDLRNITGYAWFRDRMLAYHGSNLTFSRTSVYGDFFYNSAQVIADDDPIDFPIGNSSPIRAVVPYNDNLVVFCDRAQYSVGSGTSLFTPKTVVPSDTTRRSMDVDVEPAAVGQNIYFISQDRIGYSTLLEYFVSPDTLIQDAADVSLHVHGYIPKLRKIVASLQHGLIYMLAENKREIYVNRYLWSGETKVQNAYFKWTFGRDIVDICTDGDTLYLLVVGVGLCSVRIPISEDNDFHNHYDFGVDYTGTWSDADGGIWNIPIKQESITLPDGTIDTKFFLCTSKSTGMQYRFELDTKNTSPIQSGYVWIRVSGVPYEAGSVFTIAMKFESSYVFSKQHYRDPNTKMAKLNTRSLYRRLMLSVRNTSGYVVTGETGINAPEQLYSFVPAVSDMTRWDVLRTFDGVHDVLISGLADSATKITIRTIDHLPFQISLSGFILDMIPLSR